MNKKIILIAVLIISIVVLSSCKADTIDITSYDNRQASLVDGFIYMNDTYCIDGQTVFIGDSITEFYPVDEFFKGIEGEVYNRGISGDTSNRMKLRIASTALSINPRNLIINIGINDLNCGFLPQSIADNIEECITLALANNAEVNLILVSVYPFTKELKDKIQATNTLIQALATEYGVTYVNVFDDLADSDGAMPLVYAYDNLHPSMAGYEIITNKIKPFIV